MTPKRFNTLVWEHALKHGRHTLPWRKTRNAYRILVSEVMLQQTQVERVIPYYTRFLTRFPTIESLADAPLKEVLSLWQGLGYNRRAKMLHEASKTAVEVYGGKLPKSVLELQKLPGVGQYTARAIAAFGANQDVIMIETNLRTAVIHHFFPNEENVDDAEVLKILERVYPKGRAREWYAALMDYGAFLKKQGIRVNAKSSGYTKQKSFKGSGREVRGVIVRALLSGSKSKKQLLSLFAAERTVQVEKQLQALEQEGIIERTKSTYRLPG
jgi:A/G-specific adenine glycosylase